MSTFPVLREFLKANVAINPYDGDRAWDNWNMLGVNVVRSFHSGELSLWSIQNVHDQIVGQLDANGGKLRTAAGVVCRPPRDLMWLEFVQWDGDECALLVARGELLGLSSEWGVLSFAMNANPPQVTPLPWAVGVNLSDDGELVAGDYSAQVYTLGQTGTLSEEKINNFGAWDMHLAFHTFALAHCKNVEIIERLPKRHEQRQAKRAGKPIFPYSEVVVSPTLKVYKDDEGKVARGPQGKKSMHIARGHFAHYTEDRKLFGKYSGTFWVPAHIRGSAEKGMIDQRYKVKAA